MGSSEEAVTLEYFIPTRFGKQGPFGPEVLERLVAEGKILGGMSVISADSGRRIPIEEAIGDRPLPQGAPRSRPAMLAAFAGSGFIIFALFGIAFLGSGEAHGAAELIGTALMVTLVFLPVSAALAAVINSALHRKRFAALLIGNSVAVGGVLALWIFLGKLAEKPPPPPAAPPSPVAFRADRYEITPALAWRRLELPHPSEIDLGFWLTRTRLGVVVCESTGSTPESMRKALSEKRLQERMNSNPQFLERLAAAHARVTWGPEPIPGSRMPGIRTGFLAEKDENGDAMQGVWACLGGKDEILGVMVMGPASSFDGQRKEIDAMIASIGEL
jgi:hypothetical protein